MNSTTSTSNSKTLQLKAMNRDILKPLVGKRRQHFTGVFIRTGLKHDIENTATILLRDVKLDGKIPVTNHLWLDYTKDLTKIGMLWPGDIITFTATVVDYKHAGSKYAVGENVIADDFYTEYGVQRAMKFKKLYSAPIPEDVEINDLVEIKNSPNFEKDLAQFLKYFSYQIATHAESINVPKADIDEDDELNLDDDTTNLMNFIN